MSTEKGELKRRNSRFV